MRRVLPLILALGLALSLAACGGESPQEGARENDAVESKGVFVFSPKEGFDLSGEDNLSENEVYLIHVYDILPDADKNADMSDQAADYTVTLNGTNTYESITASSGPAMISFTYASHYAIDRKIGTVFAGSDPIRAISVFQINRNDLSDNLSASFRIEGSDLYNTTLQADSGDIVTVDMLDKIFNVEDNPAQYQLASTILWRSQGIKNAAAYLSSNGGLGNGAAILQAQTAMNVNVMQYLSAGLDSSSELVFYDFQTDALLLSADGEAFGSLALEDLLQAVDAVYPEISDTAQALFAAKDSFTENLALCSSPDTYTAQALQQLNQATADIDACVQEIFNFFTA